MDYTTINFLFFNRNFENNTSPFFAMEGELPYVPRRGENVLINEALEMADSLGLVLSDKYAEVISVNYELRKLSNGSLGSYIDVYLQAE